VKAEATAAAANQRVAAELTVIKILLIDILVIPQIGVTVTRWLSANLFVQHLFTRGDVEPDTKLTLVAPLDID